MGASPLRGACLAADLSAGLTVAFVGMPQCLAYALMSGLAPAYGLVTAAVPGFVAAIVGKSPQVVTGPTNTTGLLILAAMSPYLAENGLVGSSGLAALALLTLLAGVVRIAFALLGGSLVVRFLPESVLVGFTAGAAVLIALMQLDEGLGLPPLRATGLASAVSELGHQLLIARPALPSVALSFGIVAAIALGKRLAPRWPVALLVVVAAAAGAWALGLDVRQGLPLVSDRAPLPEGWPAFALPALDLALARQFLFPATAIALLGTLELMVSARAGGNPVDMRREILAQGSANLLGAFVGAFPASASLTRSALLRLGQARSRVAPAVAALAVLPVLLLVPRSVGYIPQAALAGVLWASAFSMIDRERIKRMWRAARETRLLLLVTFGSTLLLPLEWAILCGTGLALWFHLAGTLAPRLRLLRPGPQGGLLPLDAEQPPETSCLVVEVSGDLHFAAASTLCDDISALLPTPPMRLVVDLSHAHQLRFGALEALETLQQQLAATGRSIILAGVSPEFQSVLEQAKSPLPFEVEAPEPALSAQRASVRKLP